MPRKPTKTPPEATNAPDQGVGSPQASEAAIERKKPGPPKGSGGRPSKYTPELAAEICERLSNGEPLRQICRDDHMPGWVAVYEWMARDKDLSERIAHAREQGFEALAEEALLIADTPVFGQKQVMTDQGTSTTVEDMLGHRKLQIETRLKLLAKWNPKKYGDKVQVGGDAENPLKIEADLTIFDTVLKSIETGRQSKNG